MSRYLQHGGSSGLRRVPINGIKHSMLRCLGEVADLGGTSD